MARLVILLGCLFAPGAFANFVETIAAAADTADYVNTYQVPLNKEAKLALGYPVDIVSNFTEVANRNGYQTEEHNITTEDGYILTIFRISSENCTGSKGTPVLLMHGVMESSDIFIDAGPKTGMAYLLADSCYDTWVGNCRGNNYGRAHTTLNPDKDAAFWKFSSDEMGYYDVPAHIDYILKNTGSDKLNYIGFSQGGGVVLIANSERPEYNDKIGLIVHLAPATRLMNTKSTLLKLMFNFYYKLEDVLAVAGIQETLFKGSAFQTLLEYICQINSDWSFKLCKGIMQTLDSYYLDDGITPETMQRYYAHFPIGASVQLMTRYAQALNSSYYQKYDYGNATENLAHYGSETAPIYDLSKVTTPTVIIYGANDHMVDPLDVSWLSGQLPNVLELKLVDDQMWNHFNHVYSTKLTTSVHPTVIKYLSQYTTK